MTRASVALVSCPDRENVWYYRTLMHRLRSPGSGWERIAIGKADPPEFRAIPLEVFQGATYGRQAYTNLSEFISSL
jgi:hypothetical protein